jgi:hypothetical protein
VRAEASARFTLALPSWRACLSPSKITCLIVSPSRERAFALLN